MIQISILLVGDFWDKELTKNKYRTDFESQSKRQTVCVGKHEYLLFNYGLAADSITHRIQRMVRFQ